MLIRKLLLFSVTTLSILCFLNASVAFKRAGLTIENSAWKSAPLPPAELISAIMLNFRTLAADIAWSWSVVESGETQRAGHSSEAIGTNARQIAALDPKFYPVYEWFPAAYLLKRWPVTKADLETVNRFIDIGISAYPSDSYLPYSAALTYIGYSSRHSDVERAAEAEEAIRYLEIAMTRPNANENIPGLMAYFLHRRQKLSGDGSKDDRGEIRILWRLLKTGKPEQQPSILKALSHMGVSQHEIDDHLKKSMLVLRIAQLKTQPYIPQDLWLTLGNGARQ